MNFKLELNGGQLTPRDRKLIIILAVVLIVVGIGFFVIRPLILSSIDLRKQIVVQQEEAAANDEKVMMLPQYRTMNTNYKTQLTSEASKYYAWMESQQIDEKLTNMALQYSLQSLALSITMPKDDTVMQDLAPYVNSDAAKAVEQAVAEAAAAAEAAKEQEKQDSTVKAANDAANQTNSEENIAAAEAAAISDVTLDVVSNLYTATVSMSLTGTQDNLLGFLDALLAENPKIRVTGYNWGTSGTQRDGVLYGSFTLSVTMELYMSKDR